MNYLPSCTTLTDNATSIPEMYLTNTDICTFDNESVTSDTSLSAHS